MRALPVLVSILGLAVTLPAAAQEPPPSYEEELVVREAEVVVEPPEGMSESQRQALGPSSLLLLEDGAFREITAVRPLTPDGGSWSLLIYVDTGQSGRETLARSALALARRAGRLAALGEVELIVADPEPRRLLAGTRQPAAITTALADLAATARARAEEAPAALDLAAVQARARRLLECVATHSVGGAKALILLTDFMLTPPPAPAGEEAAPSPRLLAAFPEIGQALAAFGWVTVAVGLTAEEVKRPAEELSEMGRLQQLVRGGRGIDHFAPLEAGRPSRLNTPGALDPYLEPGTALLRALLREGAGHLVATEPQLDAVLAGLGRRLLVAYRTPAQIDGRPRALEMRLLAGDLPLRVPRWRQSGSPEQLAEARGLRLLAGGRAPSDLPLTAEWVGGAEPPRLRLTGVPLSSREGGPLRLSLVFGPEAAQHLIVPLPEEAVPWRRELTLPAGTRRLAVLVEDLGRGLWSGQLVAEPESDDGQ
ncbi:MAG TPA: hypothetical protein P5144_10710 [Thermoanaerobaculia bacterium]|nr:hypothetical protein [Thermoanaerobaculia bacterium]